MNEIRTIILDFRRAQEEISQTKRKLSGLKSVAEGLYEEVDKLAKKAPAELVTDLVVSEVNEVIKGLRAISTEDEHTQRLKEFVPAGDNPEHRDVVVVLRLAIQGLDRASGHIDEKQGMLRTNLNDLERLEAVFSWLLDGTSPEEITKSETRRYCKLGDDWFMHEFPNAIDIDRLDKLQVREYFRLS